MSIQSCRPPVDAEFIAGEYIDRAESAIEERSITTLFNLLSADYHDTFERDRQDMIALASGYIRQSKSVYLFIDLRTASFLTDSRIDCTLFAALSATPVTKRSMLPDLNGEFYWVDMVLAEEGSQWRAVQATWRPALLDDFMN